MRVLQVIGGLAPGGAERSLVALAPELRARGVDVEVASLGRNSTLAAALTGADIPVHLALGRGGRVGNVVRLTRLLRARPVDLVHTALFEADVAGRLAGATTGTPVVSSLVNETYGPAHLADPALRRSRVLAAREVDAATARAVTRFHAVSESVADVMTRRLRLDRDRVEVITRGRSAADLGCRTAARRADVRRRLDVADDAALVVAAARHARQKGLDVLVQAAPLVREQLHGATVVVAGPHGNQTAELEALIARQRSGDVVRLLGPVDDVPDLLAAADVVVVPSRWEGVAGVIIEAMALEAPIVASDLPGPRETAGDVARFVPPEDPRALAAAVVEAVTDPDGASRTAAGRRRFLERHDIGAVADATVAFYERALTGPGARATRRRRR